MKLKFLALSILCLSVFPACLSNAWAADGLYQVTGTHSALGVYAGQISIHGAAVERRIHWKSYAPNPHLPASKATELETVWTGSVDPKGLHFSLSLSNVLTSFEGYEPSTDELNTPVAVDISLPGEPNPTEPSSWIEFSVPGEGSYQESWTRIGDAPLEPLWKSERRLIDATGTSEPFFVRFASWLGIGKVVEWYRSQP